MMCVVCDLIVGIATGIAASTIQSQNDPTHNFSDMHQAIQIQISNESMGPMKHWFRMHMI